MKNYHFISNALHWTIVLLMVSHIEIAVAQDVTVPRHDMSKTSRDIATNQYWATTGLYQSTVLVKLHRDIG